MLNPYAAFLGDRKPLEVISKTSSMIEAELDRLGKAVETRPATGKWNAREIVSHLADCEIVFGFRLRQALAEDGHVIQPFDQDKWAAVYNSYAARTALAVFSNVRRWNLAFLGSVDDASYERIVTHPERGTMTLRAIVETMAGHDLNHLAQLEKIT